MVNNRRREGDSSRFIKKGRVEALQNHLKRTAARRGERASDQVLNEVSPQTRKGKRRVKRHDGEEGETSENVGDIGPGKTWISIMPEGEGETGVEAPDIRNVNGRL